MVQRRRIGSAILSMAFCCGFFCSGFLVRSASAASEDEYYELMKIFVDTFEQIDRNYVTQVDRRELIEAAMRGMIIKLDPYSSYIDTKDLKSFNEHVEQEFGGIGIQVDLDPRTRQLYVVMPMPGTPAFKAGIRRGDRILEIDGKVTADFPQGQEMQSAIALIKGKPDTTVKLKVQHNSGIGSKVKLENKTPVEADANAPANVTADSQDTYEITRAVIKTPTVLGHHYNEKGEWVDMIDEGEKIAYIRLTSFGRNSAEEMHDALVKLQKEGMRGLVLDLRFNPGGLLTAATAIADDFITKGVIVSTKGRNTEEQVIMAKKSGTFSGFPMVVLVNRASASASEIVSACLQDYKRAIIVGERTWGKGSVQNVIDLDGGKSAIKLTTASYHRPSGKNIHRFPKATEKDEWGVMPDEGYNLRLTDDELGGLYDSMAERERLPREGAAPQAKFVDKQLDAGMAAIRKLLAEGKPIVEQPVEKVATPENKPEEKKTEGTSKVESRFRQSFVDAILEFLSLYPKNRTSAVL